MKVKGIVEYKISVEKEYLVTDSGSTSLASIKQYKRVKEGGKDDRD